MGANKTAVTVIALLKALPQVPNHGSYTVTLDNLFTSTKILLLLLKLGYGARGTARTNADIHIDLIKRKKSDAKDIIPWGSLDRRLVAEGKIVQIRWKDTVGYCLFMSNVDDGIKETTTKRRRPKETSTCAKTGRQPFGDQPTKDLSRPTLTWLYNIQMNSVNTGDQIRAFYPIEQRQIKGWKAIFFTLMGIITVNSYLLSFHSPVADDDKLVCHRTFQQALFKGFFDHAASTAAAAAAASRTATDTVADIAASIAAAVPPLVHCRVKMGRNACVICKQRAACERRVKKRQMRQGLQEISPNITSKTKDDHVNRTRSGCDLCKVHLCVERTGRACWTEFHR